MIKFYEVAFTSKVGKQEFKKVIGTLEQVETWADKEASLYGFEYSVTLIATHDLDGIKNLTTY
jgi:hypothetical protein